MDDRETPLLKKVKRSTRRELLVEILVRNERSGVATQTRNEPKCPSAKSADETINEMTKDKVMKRSNDARK